MSAIAGIVWPAGRKADAGAVAAMLERLAHRGPDGRKTWSKGNVALGHGLMDTLGEPEVQPLADDGQTIVADVRLDNRDELIAALGPADPKLCDARLILMAYRKWGEDCAAHLVGDFAFAIWDGKALYAARDHGGVKPFYYHAGAAGFVFASEAKGVLAAAGVPRRIEEARIAEFLASVVPDTHQTLYADVLRLPPAHWLKVADGSPKIVAYWSPRGAPPTPRKDAPEAFKAILSRAVKDRMRSASPVAAMVSGGLDSSTIACLASPMSRDLFGTPMPTLSMVFDDTPRWNERPFIDAVLGAGDFAPRYLHLDRHPPLHDLAQSLDDQDGLYVAPSMGLTAELYRASAADGHRVVLNGHGGDEVVSFGYGRLSELAAQRRFLTLWPEVKGIANTWGKPALPLFLEYLAAYGPPHSLRPAVRKFVKAVTRKSGPGESQKPQWRRLINPDLAKRTDVLRSRQAAQAPAAEAKDEYENHLATVAPRMQSYALEVLDHTAAAAGVEVRYPFWDKRLLEFTLTLTPEEKLSGGWARLVLRRAMEGVLPLKVQWRRDKLDFTPHIVLGMLRDHRDELDAILLQDSENMGQYIDMPEAAAAWRRIIERREAADGYDVQDVWRAAAFGLWIRAERELTGGTDLA